MDQLTSKWNSSLRVLCIIWMVLCTKDSYVSFGLQSTSTLVLVCRLCCCPAKVFVETGFNPGGFLASYTLQADNPLVPRLQQFVKKVLETMDASPSYSFHVEVW